MLAGGKLDRAALRAIINALGLESSQTPSTLAGASEITIDTEVQDNEISHEQSKESSEESEGTSKSEDSSEDAHPMKKLTAQF